MQTNQISRKTKTFPNKKVLLRERKRHTARRVVSTPSVVLPGYPPQAGYPPILTWLGGGVPDQGTPWPGYPPGQGTPPARVPPSQGTPWSGYPPSWTWQGTPRLDLAGYPPSCPMAFWEMLQSIMGYGYPPLWLPHGILGNIAKHYGIWVPPPVDKLTK